MEKRQNGQREWREVYGDDSEHFKSLSRGIILSIAIFLATFGVGFYFSKDILDFILSGGKEIGYEFIYLSPIEIMASQIKISAVCAFIIILPAILSMLLVFITPAIDGSMFVVVKVFIYALILFLIGAAFSYFILMPFTFRMFYNLGLETEIVAQISVQRYVDLYITLVFALGVVFEIPLLAGFLSQVGLINSEALSKWRPIALLVIMAISNIITPTTDILTALLVDIPMYLLYEISILICKRMERKKAKLEALSEG